MAMLATLISTTLPKILISRTMLKDPTKRMTMTIWTKLSG